MTAIDDSISDNKYGIMVNGNLVPSYYFPHTSETLSKKKISTRLSFKSDSIDALVATEHFRGISDFPYVKTKSEQIFIVEDGNVIAAANLTLIKIAADDLYIEDFFEACDSVDQDLCDTAEIVWNYYENIMDTSYLNKDEIIIKIDKLIIHKTQKGKLQWVKPLNKYLNQYLSNNCSVIILKAFPLQYDPNSLEDEMHHAKFLARQNAMFRFYKKYLNAERVQDREWMYIDLNNEQP